MKQQVCVIHGGTSFDSYEEYIEFIKTRDISLEKFRETYDWKASLQTDLGDAFEVLQPRMPNGTNVRYKEWKIWFERCVELMDDDLILIGHSLGGIFLAKYLSENDLSKKVKATLLVAAPYSDTSTVESLKDFVLPESLDKFSDQGGSIYIVHSHDDPIVPFSETQLFLQALPDAQIMEFQDRGHFHQSHFPELVELLKTL